MKTPLAESDDVVGIGVEVGTGRSEALLVEDVWKTVEELLIVAEGYEDLDSDEETETRPVEEPSEVELTVAPPVAIDSDVEIL